MKSMQSRNFWLSKEVFLAAAFVVLIAVPFFVFGASKVIFVDKDNKGSEDGSASHPYKTISRALKHAKSGTEVRIKNGTYKENITIPKDVKVVSDSEKSEKVIIKADNKDKPVVIMKNDSKLSHVTVKDGFHGIRVAEDSDAHIFDVIAKENKRDGIHIDKAPVKKKYRVLIDNSQIRNNGKAGIYSEKHFVVIVETGIAGNKSDGIDFAGGTEAWIEHTRSNDNGGSGAKFVMDGSEIWTKSNSFRRNGREGVEINSFGGAGKIGFKKAAFVDNGRYGIAKVARNAGALNGISSVFMGEGVNVDRFEGNHVGTVSRVIRGF